MFLISRLGRSRQPEWEVSTRAGVMVRECTRTRRIQYRDCRTGQWVDVESRGDLAWLIHNAQDVSRETPAWILNREVEQPVP